MFALCLQAATIKSIKRGEERGEGKKLEGLENASGGVQARLKEVRRETLKSLPDVLSRRPLPDVFSQRNDGRLLTSFLDADEGEGGRSESAGAAAD